MFTLLTAAALQADPPPTVPKADLQRYAGRWYEIARLPMPFQKPDESAIAEYGTNPDGTVSVHNIAIRPDGSRREVFGYAKILNPGENTKLAVRFKTWFGPFIPIPKSGNYWILHVDPDYTEALVGAPDRKYLWVLARTPTIPEVRYNALLAKAKVLGYDVTKMIRDNHPR